MKILDVVILLLSVVNAQKILSEEERNASQGSDYYYVDRGKYMTADLAISGEPDDIFHNGACSVTLASPPQSVAWWLFTFPVDTVFITNVKINYRSTKCSDRDYGFDCVDRCNTCHSTLCERFEGNCTYGCVEGFKGHQCLVSVTSQSDEQSTTDHTLNIIYAVIGTFIVTTLVCVTVFLVIKRYKRGKNTNGDTNKQNRQSTSGYRNDAYTND